MITKDELLRAKENMDKVLEPAREKLAEAKKEFYQAARVEENLFEELILKYYDETLIDANGKPVRVGDTISNGKHIYEVVNRGMQFVFGTMMFNPRVMCRKLGSLSNRGRDKHIHPAELLSFTVTPKE